MAGFFGGFHQKKRLVLVQLKTTLGQVGRFFFWGVTHTHNRNTCWPRSDDQYLRHVWVLSRHAQIHKMIQKPLAFSQEKMGPKKMSVLSWKMDAVDQGSRPQRLARHDLRTPI
jgi:hypothetical protein